MILYPFGFIKNQGLQIGQAYQGGKIAYLSSPTTGLIVSDSIISSGAWSSQKVFVSTQTSIGSGDQNTINIRNSAGGNSSGLAAKTCFDLVLNTYSDWYLPSFDEMQQVYNNRVALGLDTVTNRCWTSSQHPDSGTDFAYAFGMSAGTPHQQNKFDTLAFFAMRSF
jgi:hypothetical protein